MIAYIANHRIDYTFGADRELTTPRHVLPYNPHSMLFAHIVHI